MKTRAIKNLSALLLALIIIIALPTNALAANSSITIKDGKVIAYAPGSAYSSSDLFNGFKNVLPGDVCTESITIENRANDCNYIKIYLRAVPHDYATNPVQPAVNAALANDSRKGETDNLTYMNDFLSQLRMTVYNGETQVFSETAEKQTAISGYYYLGTLKNSESIDVTVNLIVPADLGSQYFGRVGEVDWQFLVEGFDSGGNPYTPGSNYSSLAQTGQLNWPIPVLAGTGLVLIIIGLAVKRKFRQ